MKKIALLLTGCLLLCSCSGQQEETIEESRSATVSETTETTSEFSITEADTESVVTETEEILETEPTEPSFDGIVLTPIPSDKPFDIMECYIGDNFMVKSEEDFPDKDALEYAREICFANEEVKSEIEEFIQDEIAKYPDIDEAELRRTLVAGNKISFIYGGGYDFDQDGEEEYLISLNFNPSLYMVSGILIYIDGSEYKILGRCSSDIARVIYAGDYRFMIINTAQGPIGYDFDIYSFENGMPEKVFDIGGSEYYEFRDGVFYCIRKFHSIKYPFVLCTDGVFRQIACEKITPEDFEAHVGGGKEFLDFLAENGEDVLEIYTYGYNEYELYGYGFCYTIYENNGVYKTRRKEISGSYDGYTPEYFTEELVYGADLWAVRLIQS